MQSKVVDYLDVTLNLNNGAYRPFHKLNEETTYIYVKSDYPAHLQQRKYLKIWKIAMSNVYGNVDITKN